MLVTSKDFARPVMVGLSQDGSILSWRRGDKMPKEALPAFSVNTLDEFNQIRVRFGRKVYYEDRYVWTDFRKTTDALFEAGDKMKEFYHQHWQQGRRSGGDRMTAALKRDPDTGVENDYTLRDEHASVWITVDTISVYIRRTDEGVTVKLYPKGNEDDDPALDVAQAVAP